MFESEPCQLGKASLCLRTRDLRSDAALGLSVGLASSQRLLQLSKLGVPDHLLSMR